MIICDKCVYHQQQGNAHTCAHCDTITVYGVMQEPFFDYCTHYTQTAGSKQHERYIKRIKKIPVYEMEPEPLIADTVRSDIKAAKITCKVCPNHKAQGGCKKYGIAISGGPAACKYYVDNELLRRQKEEQSGK